MNQEFQAYPTLRGVLRLPLVNQAPFASLPGREPGVVTAGGAASLQAAWTPPRDLPTSGVVTTVTIPGTVSGFRARPAWLYLPPAYLTNPRALLPVLVLVAGQPGTPRDWFDGGQLPKLMDAFAAAHEGLAPVVVVADPLGSQLANPLCVDSPAGNAFSYLSVDVPTWVKNTLQVDGDPKHWAVGGVSAGGTCALQLAVNAPAVYPTFLDFSGQVAPTLGSQARTLRERFGGSSAAFRAVNPLDVLGRRRFPASAGVVAVGSNDSRYGPGARTVLSATRAAGMDVRWAQAPGGHSWEVWRPVFAQELPWLAARQGIIPLPATRR